MIQNNFNKPNGLVDSWHGEFVISRSTAAMLSLHGAHKYTHFGGGVKKLKNFIILKNWPYGGSLHPDLTANQSGCLIEDLFYVSSYITLTSVKVRIICPPCFYTTTNLVGSF